MAGIDFNEIFKRAVAETPAEEAPKQEAPAEEAPKPEASAEEAPKPEAPAEEAPKQEAPAEEAPKQEAPAEEAPKQEAPAEEAQASGGSELSLSKEEIDLIQQHRRKVEVYKKVDRVNKVLTEAGHEPLKAEEVPDGAGDIELMAILAQRISQPNTPQGLPAQLVTRSPKPSASTHELFFANAPRR